MRWTLILTGVVLLTRLVAGEADSLREARTLTDRWVEARKQVTGARVEWEGEKEMLVASRQMFSSELQRLEKELLEVGQGQTEVAGERAGLEGEKQELESVREAARLKAVELEGRLPRLLARLPEVLVKRLEPLTARLPQDAASTTLRPAERLQTLVGILNEVEKFAGGITVESEVRRNPAGKDVEVETLYLGLTQAYFVGQGGAFAGVGKPGDAGWIWKEEEGLAKAVQQAIAIYRNQQPAAFVELPLEIQ
ncbi:MAG: hypothetical protein RI897_1849 [Verrucomicrobiota bacterium]|jgi:hypothetical protein